jgi:hypothetical protein
MVGEFTDIVDTGSFTYDELFDVLADERRRYALYYLDRQGQSMGLAELADGVARLELGIDDWDPAQRPVSDVRHIYLELYHVHVPKMEAAGIVKYDGDSGTVQMHPALEDLDLEAMLSMPDG